MLTSLVGSYPQPEWLLDREKLRGRQPPRIRAADFWRVEERFLEEAQDAATLAAIRDQERAGLDIITDGEIRRESYSNRVVMALDGVDLDHPGTTLDRNGNPFPVPRIAGAIVRRASILLRDAEFLRANTERQIKVTIPGPFTLAQQAQNDFYAAERDVAFAFADVVRAEIEDLFAAGVDVVQLDEPWMESRADQAREYGIETLQRALDGVTGTTALHICFGYPLFVPGHKRQYRFLAELADAPVDQISIETAQAELDLEVLAALTGKTIILGVIALDSGEVESAETVADRIRRALPYTSDIVAAPDCGMIYAGSEPSLVETSFADGGLLEYDALDFDLSPIDPQPWREGLRRAFRELGLEIADAAIELILDAEQAEFAEQTVVDDAIASAGLEEARNSRLSEIGP